jgi:hypothetical protein
MELIFSIIFTVSIIGFCIYQNYKSLPAKDYPPYYKDVWIYYCLPGEELEHIKLAWLSRNDNLDYIWTLSENEHIIPDEYVTKWEYA